MVGRGGRAGMVMWLALAGGVVHAQDLPFKNDDERAANLVEKYLLRFADYDRDANLAWWEASISGTDEAFARMEAAEKKLVKLHGAREAFRRIKLLHEGNQITDPDLKRQIELMYYTFLPGQGDRAKHDKLVEIKSRVEKMFNTHRSSVAGKELSENDIREILRTTTDPAQAMEAWLGYMAVGRTTEPHLKTAIRLRNELAREQGFDNYYAMMLATQEIDEAAMVALFDELDALTREPFARLKGELDAKMATRFGIKLTHLRPWHYGDLFFQEAPAEVTAMNLDKIYANTDQLAMCRTYYASMGLPCEAIIARSDFYEKPGKSPHAFCTDIDRGKDIRVLCNLKPNLYWTDTLLHEVGHAVYDQGIRRDIPFLLRKAANSITTEGIAMMFGALVKSRPFLAEVRGLDAANASALIAAAEQSLRAEKLIFSRWTQVMMRFERAMYQDPNQDLGKLWWSLKQRYQLMPPPDDPTLPGYAAKIHVLTAPVYYHSYMMGDLFAAQVHAYIATKVLALPGPRATCFYSQPKAGAWLTEQVFGPGIRYPWDELTRRATGEPLTAKYFAERYVR